jgi:hypothetical protein
MPPSLQSDILSSPSYVYLLPHRTENRFKIGKADDVALRARSLPESFDFDRARALCFENAERAFNAERVLQRLAAQYRIKELPWGDGYTEWFDLTCFVDILSLAENYLKDWLGLLGVSSLPKNTPQSHSEALPPSRKKVFDRQRASTEKTLFSGRWVSPTENHCNFRELLKPVLADILLITTSMEVDRNANNFRFWAKSFPMQKYLKPLADPTRRLSAFSADPCHGPTGPMKHYPVFSWTHDYENGAFMETLCRNEFIYVCDIVQDVWLTLGGKVWISTEEYVKNKCIRTRQPFEGSVTQYLVGRRKELEELFRMARDAKFEANRMCD